MSTEHRKRLAGCVVLGLLAPLTLASCRQVSIDSLPQPVIAAIKLEFPHARIDKAEWERAGDVKLYEVKLALDGEQLEVELAPDGMIVEIEQDVELKDVPGPVAAAATATAAGRKITQIEREETRATVNEGKVVKLAKPAVIYEVTIRKYLLFRQEVKISPDGGILDKDD